MTQMLVPEELVEQRSSLVQGPRSVGKVRYCQAKSDSHKGLPAQCEGNGQSILRPDSDLHNKARVV
jgi:hypothetical protein